MMLSSGNERSVAERNNGVNLVLLYVPNRGKIEYCCGGGLRDSLMVVDEDRTDR